MNANIVKRTVLDNHVISTVRLDDPLLRSVDSIMKMFSDIDPYSDRPALKTNPIEFMYETMVFPARDGEITDWHELDCVRYHTVEEAVNGHDSLVEKWTAAEGT